MLMGPPVLSMLLKAVNTEISPKKVNMELHTVYNRDRNGLLFIEFGPERGHIELAYVAVLLVT